MSKVKLLNVDANAKIEKNKTLGYITAGLHLAPERLSGYNVCPMATDGCKAACLNTAGRGRFNKTQEARIRKTKMFFEDRANFMLILEKELVAFFKKAKRMQTEKAITLIPSVRLNLTSDIRWETVDFVGADGVHYKNLMERFPDIQFYDYSKISNRKRVPTNYHLTFSLAENNEEQALQAYKNGMNIAVVFRDKKLPEFYMGIPVFNGDDTDLRFLDPKGVIVGLYAKGKAKKDTSGFVKDSKIHLPLVQQPLL